MSRFAEYRNQMVKHRFDPAAVQQTIQTFISQMQERLSAKPRLYVIVYIRKSDAQGYDNSANYLMSQERIPEMLVAGGIPRDRIITINSDVGTSGALPVAFRDGMALTFEMLDRGEVCGVVAGDASRFFRDRTLRGPVEFAMRCARCNARVLTSDGSSDVRILNLNAVECQGDYDWWIEEHKANARMREKIRETTGRARWESVLGGGFVGGKARLGYRAVPSLRKSESRTQRGENAALLVYEPHRDYVLQVWRIAMYPEIDSYPKLRRHLVANQVLCPPFDDAVRSTAFPRSNISCMKIEGRPLRNDEAFIPSRKMLPGLLLDWTCAGYRFYGSGESGKYRLAEMERIAAATCSLVDSQVSVTRDYVDRFPDQALFEVGSEEEELFWAVQRKWSRIDPASSVASEFEDMAVPNVQQTAGRSRGVSKPRRQAATAWAGRVWCARHGVDDNGRPIRSHPMTFQPANSSMWLCRSDYMRGDGAPLCTKWQNRLSAILDTHLARGLQALLANKDGIIEEAGTTREYLLRQRESVADEKRTLERRLRTKQAALEDMVEAGADKDTRQEYAKAEIVPITSAIAARRAEHEQITEQISRLAAEECSPETVVRLRDVLARAVKGLADMPMAERQAIVATFVDGVDVLIGDGEATRVVAVLFRWRSGWTDVLVSFRGPATDSRPLTDAEASVIRSCWCDNGVEFAEWRTRLLPGRKFAWVQRQAQSLGVTGTIRKPAAWIRRAFETNPDCWGDDNADVLYLQLSTKSDDRCLPVFADGRHGQVLPTPEEVLLGLRTQQTILLSPSA